MFVLSGVCRQRSGVEEGHGEQLVAQGDMHAGEAKVYGQGPVQAHLGRTLQSDRLVRCCHPSATPALHIPDSCMGVQSLSSVLYLCWLV